MTVEDTGLIHLTPPDDCRKHVTHGMACPCDPLLTAGRNVVIHRKFKRDE